MSDRSRAAQPQKMDRGLKFQTMAAVGFYYQCSENKGADQLREFCTAAADLDLCFHICKKVFSHKATHMVLGGILFSACFQNSVIFSILMGCRFTFYSPFLDIHNSIF